MSVGAKTARAAIWAFLSTAGAKAVTLIGLTLLARLLAPKEFGLLAFAMVYITYAEAIGDLGTGTALVYWPDRRNDAAQVTFIVNVIAGIGWCIVTLIIAPYVADFFNAENGTAIIRVIAFSFILRFLGNTHDALLQKDLRFRARMIPDLSLALVKAILAIILAYFGFGAWSLIWAHLAGLGTRTVLVWFATSWRPNLTFPRDLFKPMLSYGRGIITVNVLGAVGAHADMAIVGHYLGTTQLGLYQLATKIPETTTVVLLWVLSRVLFPAFAKMHAEGGSLRQPYLISSRYIVAITMPAAIGTMVLSHQIVEVFFGKPWLPAAPVLSAFAAYTGFRCLSTNAGDILKATGRAKILARLAYMKTGLTLPALLFAAQFSTTAIATALAIVAAFNTCVTLTVASRVVDVKLRRILAAFVPGTFSAAIMGAAVFAWLQSTPEFSALSRMTGGIVIGAIVYMFALLLIDRDLVSAAKRHFSALRKPVERTV